MIRLLGVIFLCILIDIPILLIDSFVKNGFLDDFFGGDSVTLMGTLLGLELVVVVFMIQCMTEVEFKKNKSIFSTTKREIKHDTVFLFSLFTVHLLILIFTPKFLDGCDLFNKHIGTLCKGLNVFLFTLFLFCLYNIIKAAFTMSELVIPNPNGKDMV